MNAAPGLTRLMAHALAHHAARGLPFERTAWAEPMRQEVDAIEDDLAALRWAAGCVVATYSERITTMSLAPLSPVLGLVAVIAFLLGGYALAGGNLDVIIEALPHELFTIVLGALAATTILTTVGGRGVWKSLMLSLQGRRFRIGDYRDLAVALVSSLAAPKANAPAMMRDVAAARMVADGSALLEQQIAPDQIGLLLQTRIAGILGDHQRAVLTLRSFALTLLWFGGAAFLFGVIDTLGQFHEPLEAVGGMFGASTIGLIVGVMVAVGIVQPLAARLEAAVVDDGSFYEFIRTALVCRGAGSDPALAVRVACGALPEELAFSANELAALENIGRAI